LIFSYKLTFNLKYAGGPAPPAWIAQAMEAMRRRMREAHEHGAARGWGYAMLWRLPQNIAAIGIGQNEPCVLGHDVDGHALGNGKIELVAMGAILTPFCIRRAKIGD
jgi:hypothetical protein